ncbi:MAG TPA: hypothetical protein VN253_05250, partial [Kofleriaceae bacterium]|nr:hypothetical protein [Kofleriaceae bacterium]
MARSGGALGACAAVAAVGAWAACGARAPQASWIEREDLRGELHARPAGSGAPSDPAAVMDLGKLDGAAIDALDEPAVLAALARAGTATPAARLA